MTHRADFRGGREAGTTRPLALFFLSATAIVLAAGTLLYAQSERGDYTQRNLGSLAQPVVPAPTDDAKYSIGSYPLYWPELEAGEGKGLVTGYCNTCHSPRFVLMQPPLTRDQWAAEVGKMVKTFGLDIPESDQAIVIKYLAEHYSPETRKK